MDDPRHTTRFPDLYYWDAKELAGLEGKAPPRDDRRCAMRRPRRYRVLTSDDQYHGDHRDDV